MMTRKAHALGMSHTLYRNASGLPNDEQITTAHDLTILGRARRGALPALLPLFLDRTSSTTTARSSAITIICSAASTASTASRPATPAPPASIS